MQTCTIDDIGTRSARQSQDLAHCRRCFQHQAAVAQELCETQNQALQRFNILHHLQREAFLCQGFDGRFRVCHEKPDAASLSLRQIAGRS